MLFQLLDSPTPETLINAMAWIIALILGITVHEFSHALAATWLGDPLPQRQGRLTLSPLAHLDPVGTLMLLVAPMGWGKPVQYNPYALRANLRYGPLLVSVAGPLSNFILAVAFAIPTRLAHIPLAQSESYAAYVLSVILTQIVYLNLMLGFFNLIPIFPLDGFAILRGLLPPELAEQFEQTRQWGPFILLLLVFAGGSVLGLILYRPVGLLMQLLTGTRF